MDNKDIKSRYYSLEDLEYLIEHVPYAVWLKGSDGIYKYVNKYYASLTNMKPEDIIGKNDYEVRDKKTAELFISEDKEILNNNKTVFNRKTPVNMEFKNFFEASRVIVENNNKEIKLIGGVGRNITINENLDKEIEKSTLTLLNDKKTENKSELPFILKSTLNAGGITIFMFDRENKRMNIFLKTYDDTVLSKDFGFYVNEDSERICLEAYNNNKCLETYSDEDIKIHIETKVIGYIRTYFIQFENELIGILNVHYDKKESYSYIQEDIIRSTCDRLGIVIKNRLLTNKYKIELERRKETEKKLQIFLETSIDFYIISDRKNINLENSINKKRLEEYFGYSIEEIIERSKKRILRHPDDEKNINEIYEKAKNCGKYYGVVIRYLCKDKQYKSVEWNFRYIREDEKFYITGKDITSRLKLEKEKMKLEKTVEIESLKTDFFANMSHEFKTPLNIILTTVQVLTDRLDNETDACRADTIRKYLKGIKQNSYRLLKIVNNIMDITKIDSGSYNLELGNHNIVSVVEDIVLSVVGYLSQNKRNIVFDTMEEEIILACDPMKIERIILNLLSNALKYTYENGNIEVFIDVDKKNNEAVISVKNDGDPISEEDKEKIFERFTQSDNLLTRRAEGTGIGLFLVKMLVEMHGGRIYVKSSKEEGTEFVFTIPIRMIEENKQPHTYEKQIISKVETCNIEFSDIYSI